MTFSFNITNKENKQQFLYLKNIFGISWLSKVKFCTAFGLNISSKYSNLTYNGNFPFQKLISNFLEKFLFVDSQLKQIKYFNLKKLKDLKNYKGIRHLLHLSVRGQRTHTNCQTQRRINR